VSHYADGITSQHQKICQQRLEKKFGTASWKLVRACVRFDTDAVPRGGAENTQRSRSFLFFALGVLGASSLGKPTKLEVPENGLIALNPPLDALRIGALSTRTTHPFFMRRFEDLVAALGINVTLVNRYRHMTKGQMIRKCLDKVFLKAHMKDTMSCSSPTKGRWKKKKPGHCGYCVPCLIRRAAIMAGIGSDDTPYAISDLSAELLDSRTATGTNIRSFLLAARRLKATPVLAKVAIHASGPLREFPDEWEAYARMYADGIGEVAALLKNVTTERP
jgi:hypothetical protein